MRTLVRIIKNWDWPDLMRQTPGGQGIWEDVQFTLDPVAAPDYVIVLNHAPENTTLRCAPEHIWAIMQEPPDGFRKPMHKGQKSFARIYTQDVDRKGERFIYSHPVSAWHVNRDYDALTRGKIPAKERNISWITSNLRYSKGHQARMRFLEGIRGRVEFDLFGRGFQPIEDKWDGLAPYRYSFAVENYSNPYIWSEKIADCYLSWSMPIYHGCTRITEYFPPESLIQIDPADPLAVEKIQEAVTGDLWRRNLDAIAYARKLVLDKYQLFPFVRQAIAEHEAYCEHAPPPPEITIRQWKIPFRYRCYLASYQRGHALLRKLERLSHPFPR